MRSRVVGWVALVVALVGGLLLPGSAGAAPTSNGATWSSASVALPNGAIGYDAVRGKLLVAVAPTVPGLGNELVEMDPHTGALGRSVLVGSDPGVIAVSGDSSRAYVGLKGSPTITEVDLASFTVVRHVLLGNASLGPDYADDIAVQPGSPEVIAVSLHQRCCSEGGTTIYDAGTKRPSVIDETVAANRLAWSAAPGVLYAYNNVSSSAQLYTLAIDGSGLHISRTSTPLTGFNADIAFGDGLLHATGGTVIDPATMTKVGDYGVTGPLDIDAAQHKTFVLSGPTLRRFDIATRAMDWSATVPDIGAQDLVDAGGALAATNGSVVLLLGDGVSSSGFSLPPGPATLVQAWTARGGTGLHAERLVSSPDGVHVYAVVRAAAPTHANQLVEVNAQTRTIGRTLLVGNDPYRLSISDDGSTILVAHRAANRLTQVDVATFAVTHTLPLAANEWGSDLAPRPGSPHEFAVTLANFGQSPQNAGVILEQDGAIAPTSIAWYVAPNWITFAGDANRLYGYNDDSSQFFTIDVTTTGLSTLSTSSRGSGSLHGELVASFRTVYSGNGDVIDPTGPSEIAVVPAAGIPRPMPAEHRMLVVTSGTIEELSLDSYGTIDSQVLPVGGVVDAAIAGSTVALVTQDDILFVGLGPDTRVAPGAPTRVVGHRGDQQATVSWNPPASDGGAPITDYTVIASPGGATCHSAYTGCVVPGLVNLNPYSFTVTATNEKGTSPSSAPSGLVVPVPPPAAPTDLRGTGANGSVTLRWTASTTSGATATGYEVRSRNSPAACDVVVTTCVITNLVNGGVYVFDVRATSDVGIGPGSMTVDVVPTSCGQPGLGPFNDVGTDHPFCADIEWMRAYSISTGFADGSFRPGTQVTREAIAAFVYRLASSPPFTPPVVPTFTDVHPGTPFYVAVEWMAAHGFVKGYGDGTFRPSAMVSREALAAMIYRMDGSPTFTPPATPSFSDVTSSSTFSKEIEWLAATGIAHGFPDGTFRPAASITREASAHFLHGFLQLVLNSPDAPLQIDIAPPGR